ncbi:hypothetical protein Patl1_15372 [Pistacia atlantica]|uniref:Uncharacterized protein n=1 Tax=Pistacia atlantica TaxID=434234 RepID=A0ACC1B8J6_9ROSI|nr:hypothetical protein Patl1_15372 [Pistacia atlantica]
MGKSIILYGFVTVEQPKAIKQFLEQILGKGVVTDVGVQQNEGSRAYAIVHFTSSEAVDTIKSLADEHLWYRNSYLKARDMGEGHRIYDVQLHFGFQLSKKKFSSLWTQENVSIKFGFGRRKIIFFLSHHSVEYKLQLPYESIRLVELRRLQDKRFIIIQIYLKDVPHQTLFRDDTDVEWVHEVDFTQSSCIGQSTALCLELPTTNYLSNFQKDFAYYKENKGKLIVERGSTSSCHSDHVPINMLFRHYFTQNNVALNLDNRFEPRRWLRKEYQKYSMAARPPMLPATSLSHGLVYMCRVLVIPSKVYFFSPEVVLSNNVLRTYPDDGENFIRVSFVNEDLEKVRATHLSARASLANTERRTRVYQRILSTLRNGIVIGDKKFEFLAFSNSQLKDNSLWMFASRPGLTASELRERLGDFSAIRNVAKYSARLSQSFNSSREAVDVDSNEIEVIPDIEVERGAVKYVFSDGIGKISTKLARMVTRKCGFKYVPSAFHIQYGSYKGVVVVDPTSPVKLSMRPSMSKYKSDNVSVDILEWSKYQPCYLNRQLVILLSTLDHQTELSNNSSALLSGRVSSQSRILEQRVIVAKNPCLHPRDVRKLKVVNVPALHHMVNCIVFPAKGEVKDLMPKMGILKSFTADEARHFYDLDMEVEGFKDYIDDAFYYKSEYDYRLGNLMDYFGISTEGEILSGRIMKMVKSFSKKRDLEGIKLAVKSLIREAREWFNKKANESDGPEKVYMKALAWYYVTYHPSF